MKQIALFKTVLDRTDIDNPFLALIMPKGIPEELRELYSIIVDELLSNREVEKVFLDKEELCSFVLEIPKEVELDFNRTFEDLFANLNMGEEKLVGAFLLCCDPQEVNLDAKALKLIDIFTKFLSNAIIDIMK